MSGDVLCFIPGPRVEIAREPEQVRWCFGCRSHLPHDWVLLDDVHPDDVRSGRAEPSYYEPIWVRHCSRCGKDRTQFPGTVW